MPRELREVPVKQGSGIRKSGKVFGQGQKTAKQIRTGMYARVSTLDSRRSRFRSDHGVECVVR
jgi:hypothetical protein